jgi:hypothetical protein
MNQVMGALGPVYDWFEPGLLAYAGVDGAVNWMQLGIQMGVIALVLALLMREFGAILIFTVVGVIIHFIVDIVMPIVRGGEEFSMDAVMAYFQTGEGGDMMIFAQYAGALAVGYFFGIIILSIFKGLIFRGD